MQELMSRHKAYALNPRDCLKTTLFQKWQKIVAPPGKYIRNSISCKICIFLHLYHKLLYNRIHNRQKKIVKVGLWMLKLQTEHDLACIDSFIPTLAFEPKRFFLWEKNKMFYSLLCDITTQREWLENNPWLSIV